MQSLTLLILFFCHHVAFASDGIGKIEIDKESNIYEGGRTKTIASSDQVDSLGVDKLNLGTILKDVNKEKPKRSCWRIK